MKSVKVFLSSLLLGLVLVGCIGTVKPVVINSNGPSWDGNERNSGFIGYITNNTGVYGVITPHARDRYNTLIDEFGYKIPKIKKDYGITDNTTNCYITLEALSKFGEMNWWAKQPHQ